MSLMNLYAQHLGAEDYIPTVSEEELDQQFTQAAEQFARADAVVVGIGSGMSTSCGYDHYHRTAIFDEQFSRFEKTHGFTSLMDGFYHLYGSNEDRWGFLASYITYMEECPIGSAYKTLRQLLESKDYFVLTTNIDGQVRRSFPEDKVWLFQGDFGYLQCSQPCHDELYPAKDIASRLRQSMEKEIDFAKGEHIFSEGKDLSLESDVISVPSDMLPRCPECGWLLSPWVRDHGFLEGEFWRKGKQYYQNFLHHALYDEKEQVAVSQHSESYVQKNETVPQSRRVLFLELGVGGMTPSIIEIPFWEMTKNNPNAFYLRVNIGKVSHPLQLEGQSLTVSADIGTALREIQKRRG